jgi:predicted dehydrogenase
VQSGPLEIALLGCGTLAEILADQVYPAVREDVRVVAAIDVRPERARQLAERLGAQPFESLDAACAASEVQAVDIRLPHHLHRLGAELAAERGLPFLIEKPLATSLAGAREIEVIARSIGPSCGVAENYAFLAPVRSAAERLAGGDIGQLLAVQATRVFELGEEWRRDGWRLSVGQAGDDHGAQGVIVDQATHVARLMRTVVGEPAEVHAFASSRRIGWAGPDSAAVVLRFESGVVGTELLCWACPTPAAPEQTPELTLLGSRGSISVYVRYSGPGGGALVQRPGKPEEWYGTGMAYYDSLGEVLRDWAGAVRAGRAPVSSMAEGMRDAAIMDAIARSAELGEPVPIAI